MESLQVQRLRKLIPSLPEKDISIGMKLLEARDWGELYNLVSSAIVKVERSNANEDGKYSDIDIASLYRLQSEIPESLDDYE